MTIDRERAVVITAVVLVLTYVIALIVSNIGPSEADKVEIYSDCITRQIEAGSPTWADTVAACEAKRP